jgi:hypothetical protein
MAERNKYFRNCNLIVEVAGAVFALSTFSTRTQEET